MLQILRDIVYCARKNCFAKIFYVTNVTLYVMGHVIDVARLDVILQS